MSSFQKCIFMGNLTKDPEIKYTPKGTAVAEFGIALNRVYKNAQDEKCEEVTFINLTAFGRTAEVIGDYQKKGDLGFYEAHVKTESWDDKETGKKKYATKFIVDSMKLMPNKRRDGEEPEGKPRQAAKPAGRGAPPSKPPPDPDLDAEGDDIPF